MRIEDVEKIVFAVEAMDQNFPEMKPGTDRRIIEYRRNLLKVAVDGLRLIQILRSEESSNG
jgi:hypothetical protein